MIQNFHTGEPRSALETDSLPINWRIEPLGSICSEHKHIVDPNQLTATPYVGLEHLVPGVPRLSAYGTSEEVISSKTLFRSGHVLYGKLRPYLDKAALASFSGICSTDIIVLEAREEKSTPEFLVNLLHTSDFQAYATSTMTGVNHPRTHWSMLKTYLVTLPPIPEQQQISTILNVIQDSIAVQDDIITEARAFKRSLMHHLFTHGTGSETAETKETDSGEFPLGWNMQPLRELCTIEYGYQTSIPKTPPPNGVWIISTAEIKNEGYLDISKIRKVEIDATQVERYRIKQNDVLFNWRNSQEHVGKTALVGFEPLDPIIYASFILRIRPRMVEWEENRSQTAVSYSYVHYLLSCLRDRGIFFKLSRRAVNQANFNANQLGELEVPVPSPEDQAFITDLLVETDSKIGIEEDRKTALQDLFKTMLHELMSGKIRLLSDLQLPT